MTIAGFKKQAAELACGAILIGGMFFGSLLLWELLALHGDPEGPLARIPGAYLLVALPVIFGFYLYGLVKLMSFIAERADL